MHFRPEFLNRVDDIILFSPLTQEELVRIVGIMTEGLKKRLADQQISLNITDEAAQYIANEAYDPAYGARPLKRFLQRQLETKLGRALISGEISEGSAVKVTMRNGELSVEL